MEPVDVVNLALDHLGQSILTALTDSNDTARRCSRRYDTIRKAELRDHDWIFASNRATLEYSTTNLGGYEWTYSYNVATDCLKIRAFYPQEEYGYRWKVEKGDQASGIYRRILTNVASPVRIRFTEDIEDPDDFDPLFVEALAARIAAELALPITNDPEIVKTMWAMYDAKIGSARLNDAIEAQDPDQDAPGADEGTWITDR